MSSMKIWKNGTIVDKSAIITLGVESSCDDTSVAVVLNTHGKHEILANVVFRHCMQKYGGVVPELVARAHVDCISQVFHQALEQAGITVHDIDMVGFTFGPGLIGGLIVSTVFGKMLSSALRIPGLAINHLEGHIFSAMLEHEIETPFLTLLVTGGHSQIILVNDVNKYKNLGGTIDDAVGESFDKVARMLGLGYPGGQEVEEMALQGDPLRFTFPRATLSNQDCKFSCSGTKTAVKLIIDKMGTAITEQDKSDICASFQLCMTELLIAKLKHACCIKDTKNIVVVGGVAANKFMRSKIEDSFGQHNIYFPSPNLCSDNGAMIAIAAYKKIQKGYYSGPGVLPDPSANIEDFMLD